VERHVNALAFRSLGAGELLHRGAALVRAEGGFPAHPLGALAGDGLLGQLVAEADFEFAAVEAALALHLGDVELAVFFPEFIGNVVRDEGGRGEDEFEGIDLLQFLFESLVGVDGEARGGDLELRAGGDGAFQIVAEQAGDVVEEDQIRAASPIA
jgi:hypothetical protein